MATTKRRRRTKAPAPAAGEGAVPAIRAGLPPEAVAGANGIASEPEAWPEVLSLSPREREITRLVARGLPNKTIAYVLEISPWTVATHLRRVFAKLNVSSRTAMVTALYELQRASEAGSGT